MKTKTLAEWRRTTDRKVQTRGRPGPVLEPVYRYIGAIVLEMRERHGLTQEQLAKRLAWHRPQVTLLETGRRRLHIHDLEQLSAVLRIPITDLLPPEYRWGGTRGSKALDALSPATGGTKP